MALIPFGPTLYQSPKSSSPRKLLVFTRAHASKKIWLSSLAPPFRLSCESKTKQRMLKGCKDESEITLVKNLEDWFPGEDAKVMFEELEKELEGKLKYYNYRGKPLPRTKTFLGSAGPEGETYRYYYTGGHLDAKEDMTPTIKKICDRVREITGQEFNTVVPTRYKDHREYINAHHDKTGDWVVGASVVSVSFGAERQLVMERGEKYNKTYPLPSGSLYIIPWRANMKYTHQIPAQDKECGPRISLTFRVIDTRATKDGKKEMASVTDNKPVSRATLLKKRKQSVVVEKEEE